MIELYPPQQDLKSKIYKSWDNGNRNVLAVYPTGGGKTVICADIIHEHQGASCMIAHRQELVSQISMALAKNEIMHRIIGPKKVRDMIVAMHMQAFNRHYTDPSAQCAVAGVDTLIRRGRELAAWLPTVTLCIQDEAHHILKENKWGKAANMMPNAKLLGVTATPLRADGKGLGHHADGIMDDMVVGISMREAINLGYLTEYRIFAPPSTLDLSTVNKSKTTGDYILNQLGEAVARSSLIVPAKNHIVGDIVEHYLRIAPGKRGITFVPDMVTGEEVTRQFNAADVPAMLVNAKTPDDQRALASEKLKNKQLLQLVNVDIFGEGFDLPAIEVVSFGRASDSFGLFTQQFGRVLRTLLGKEYGIIIDHVGAIAKHKLPDAPRVWTLDRRDKRAKSDNDNVTPVKTCPECTRTFERYIKACPECGHIPVPAIRSGPEFVDGDLFEIDPETLMQMREEVTNVHKPAEELIQNYRRSLQEKHTPKIWEMSNVKKYATKIEHQKIALKTLTDDMAMWAGYRRAEGKTDDEIFRIFYLSYGVDWLSAQCLPGVEAEKLNNRIDVL